MDVLSVQIESALPAEALHIAPALARDGIAVTTVRRPAKSCVLRHRAPGPALAALITRLKPFRLGLHHVPDLDGADAVICLGDDVGPPFTHYNLQARTDDAHFGAAMQECLTSLGFRLPPPKIVRFIAEPRIRYGGASSYTRAVLSSAIGNACGQFPSQIKEWDDDDNDLYVDIPSRPVTGSLRERIPIDVRTDDPAAFAVIQPLLAARGFPRVAFQSLAPSAKSRLTLHPGPLSSLGADADVAALAGALDQALGEFGIDRGRYPLDIAEPSSDEEGSGVQIDMPVGAIRSGVLRGWSRMHPEAYEVTVYDDDRTFGLAMMKKLRQAGFAARRRPLRKISEGFVLRCEDEVPGCVLDRVAELIDSELVTLGAHDFGVHNASGSGDERKLELELPVRAFRSGRLLQELSSPGRFAAKIIGDSTALVQPVVDRLATFGFGKLRGTIEPRPCSDCELRFGGAPEVLLARVASAVADVHPDIVLTRVKAWPMHDHDLWIRLPSGLGLRKATTAGNARPPLQTPPPPRATKRRPLVRLTRTHLIIADVELPRLAGGHPRVIAPDRFAGFCVDQGVADTLWFVAAAWRGRFPAALDGPTAASKTHSILFVASMLRCGVHRLNFSAHTDPSEIKGLHVPDTSGANKFRIQMGPAPLAMLEGALLLLDEINLAPAETVELCNPLLEMPPTLHLPQLEGRVIDPAHPDFRVLATWNNASYAGRQELSPALLDRFKIRSCGNPTEADFRALCECLVHGSQPEVVVNGARYVGGAGKPALPELKQLVPELDRFLTALARFHSAISSMAEKGELRTRGRAAFTRRALVDTLREIRTQLLARGARSPNLGAAAHAAWQALILNYLARLDPQGEREKAETLLGTCGIGPTAWELPDAP
ncbi:MAG: AAA family ATPase [Acidisphaera sp.]|nr:AAA family ATPase [Acidisphaera sp.]